jgi:mannose-6-phosphate isomerase-like protein (cupin superfamily)
MPAVTAETPHRHQVAWRMFYVLAGELTMDVGGEAFQLRVQGGLEIAPGPPHQAINRSDDDVHVLVRSMPTARGQLRGANDAGRRESTAEAVVWAIGLYQPSLAMTLAAGFPRESNADS